MDSQEEPGSKPVQFFVRFLEEIGIVSVYRSHTDAKLLIFQRFVRLFAYGSSTLILAAYLSDLGIPDAQIGLFMTLTLVGDVLIGFCLTLVADGLGRRKILALGALLMAASGVIFAISGNYWVLLVAAILGVISPSGNEVGPFRAIEESTLAHLTASEHRSDIFAWYSLIGTGGTALGFITSGWVTNTLINSKEWDTVRAYRVVYYAYTVIGLIKFTLTLMLSSDCEAEKQPSTANTTESDPLLGTNNKKPKKKSPLALVPKLSKESKTILLELCLLFAFDNFASGLAPLYVFLALCVRPS
jgi:MFS family permease